MNDGRIVFFDTETTGIVLHKQGPEHPDQPHLLQIAARLHDAERREIARINMIVRPEGFVVDNDSKAVEIHGITHERAMAEGVPLSRALLVFDALCQMADLAVCHNTDFDIKLAEAEYIRLDWTHNLPMKKFCTMKAATEHVKAPPFRYGTWKWPKLSECMVKFFGEELIDAHNADVDISACVRIFYHLQDIGIAPLAKTA